MVTDVRFFSVVAESRAHLAAVRETYFQHMRFAATVGAMLVAAGIACTLHSVIPGLCTSTASRTIRRLNTLLDDRDTLPDAAANTTDAVGFAFLLILSAAAAAWLWIAGGSPAIALPLSLLALGLPAALLAANPELEWFEEAHSNA